MLDRSSVEPDTVRWTSQRTMMMRRLPCLPGFQLQRNDTLLSAQCMSPMAAT